MAEGGKEISGVSYVLYYMLLFFAYWFGSSRFDQDGDGDFDPEDVQAYLADKGFLKGNFKGKAKATAKGKAKAAPKAQPKPEEKKKDGGIFDTDGDGDVDINDAIQSKTDGAAAEDEIYENLITKQRLPWFIIFECVATFGLWIVFAIKRGSENGTDPLVQKAGLDSLADEQMDLRIAGSDCEDYRPQIWRWLTYQFTHVGAMHVLMNCFLNVMLGIPLEGLHGTLRMIIMFNVGVFGGSCCYFFNDAHTAVVGCSGGCYSLIGIHLADLIMNWRQKKFRIPTLVFILVLVFVDVFSYAMSLSSENASHSAHIGGAVAGLIIGCLLGKNLKVMFHEKVIMGVALGLGFVMVVFSLGWLFGQADGPRNIWEAMAGDSGWCWIRQFYDRTVSADRWECVRCGTDACMAEWSKYDQLRCGAGDAVPGADSCLSKVSRAVCNTQGFYHDGR